MNDNINEIGKYLRETNDRTSAALSRYIQPRTRVERVRDVFDSVISFDMYFNTEREDQRVMLDLFFQEPIPCHNNICSNCETFEADQDYAYGQLIITTTHSYIAGSVNAYKAGIAVSFTEISPSQGRVKIKAYVFMGEIITICYNNKEDETTTPPIENETDYGCCVEYRDDFNIDDPYDWPATSWGDFWFWSPAYGRDWTGQNPTFGIGESGKAYLGQIPFWFGPTYEGTQQNTGGIIKLGGTTTHSDAWTPPDSFRIITKFKFLDSLETNFAIGICYYPDGNPSHYNDYWGGPSQVHLWARPEGGNDLSLMEGDIDWTIWEYYSSIPFIYSLNTDYLLKWERINGATSAVSRVKVWKEVDPEPDAWTIESTSKLTIKTPYQIHIYSQHGSEEAYSTIEFDYFIVQELRTDCEEICSQAQSNDNLFDGYDTPLSLTNPPSGSSNEIYLFTSPWGYDYYGYLSWGLPDEPGLGIEVIDGYMRFHGSLNWDGFGVNYYIDVGAGPPLSNGMEIIELNTMTTFEIRFRFSHLYDPNIDSRWYNALELDVWHEMGSFEIFLEFTNITGYNINNTATKSDWKPNTWYTLKGVADPNNTYLKLKLWEDELVSEPSTYIIEDIETYGQMPWGAGGGEIRATIYLDTGWNGGVQYNNTIDIDYIRIYPGKEL